MLKFIDGIRHQYAFGINNISYSDLTINLNTWLSNADGYLIESDINSQEFTITTYDIMDFLIPYTFDINRLSCASIESLNNIYKHDTSPKFLGWNLTKYYYSAFFSAHCILRLTGRSITNLEKITLNKVRSRATSYGYSSVELGNGSYCVDIDYNNRKIKFFKDSNYDDSHKGLWKRFLELINELNISIYKSIPTANAQIIVDKLQDLKAALCFSGGTQNNGAWLSQMRNKINYSQSYGVWFPYKNYQKDYDRILSLQTLSKEDPLNIDIASERNKELVYFTKACQLINSINYHILSDLKNSHPDNKSFVKNGIFRYHEVNNTTNHPISLL